MSKVAQEKEKTVQAKSSGNSQGNSMAPPPFQLKADPIQRATGDPEGAGYVQTGQTLRELGFALRHPIAAMAIGIFKSGSTNISTNAVRFATNDLGLQEHDSREGSEVNAFRHTLWQAEITEEFGQQIAHEAGNAHEANPFAIGGRNRNTTTFDNRADADESCDLRNNEIGRSIGSTNDEMEMNQLALQVIEYFHDHGLWVIEEREGGTFEVVQRRIADEEYEEARARLLQLNAVGRDATQQGAVDAEARAELERMRIRDQFGPKF